MMSSMISDTIIIIVYLIFLSILGTAGNSLVLVVFYRKKDKQVSTFFILILAIVDFTTCLILIPCTIFMEYWDFRISQDFICKSYMMLNGGMIHFSALIMVAIALERYFSICHPFLRVLTLRRAKYILVGLASAATALGICIALTHGIIKDTSVGFNSVTPGYFWNNVTTLSNLSNIEVYKEYCQPHYLILSQEFQTHFQRLSNTLYLVYLAIVIVLYALIYRSVMTRRARRQKQKSACLIQVRQAQEKAKLAEKIVSIQANNIQGDTELNNIKTTTIPDNNLKKNSLENEGINLENKNISLTVLNVEDETVKVKHQQQQIENQGGRQRQKNKKQMVDGTMLANMKTAAMLFVVTVVFFVTFTPAFLSSTSLIEFKAYLFYLYFANNVANPIIYSFMNRNFRTDLKKLFCNKVN